MENVRQELLLNLAKNYDKLLALNEELQKLYYYNVLGFDAIRDFINLAYQDMSISEATISCINKFVQDHHMRLLQLADDAQIIECLRLYKRNNNLQNLNEMSGSNEENS